MGGHRIFTENEGISRSANLFRVVSNNTQRVPSDIRDASMAIQECLSGCAATSARAIWQSPPFSQASMVGLQIWGTLGTGSHALWTYFSLCSARTIEPLGFMERAMGIEPSRDSRYVAEIIGYSCELPSKTVHNRVTDAKKPRQISSNSW
jgi:hypothetical protein